MSALPRPAGIDASSVVVRPLSVADVPAVARLEREIFSDPWTEEAFRREARTPHGFSLVAEVPETGAIVAYMIAWLVADEAHLGNLAVSPEARRAGLAQCLLDRLHAAAESRRARLVTLEVRRSNAVARALYLKNGYYAVMVRKAYYTDNREDALVMVKALTESGRIPPRPDLERS